MVLLAFSLQAEVEKYGAYVGIAAFFGLAVLSLLYFAQAREVKRLREWAGRAPERAAELEVAVAEHAQEVRRAPVTPVPRPQPVVQPLSPSVAVAATNGAVKLKPEEVAALAFARAAGVHDPHLPKAHSVAVAAPPAEVAAAAAIATEEPAAAQALNGGGNGTSRSVPAPSTPAARRGDVPPPPPLPPRRAAGTPGRRPAAPPPRREGSSMAAVVLTAIVGVIVLGGAIFLFTRGGDDPNKPSTGPTVEATPTPDSGSGGKSGGKATATPSSAPTKATALIAIYNGTPQGGLAADEKGELTAEGYPDKHISVDNAPAGQQRVTSVVFYRRGAKAAASGVADTLGITDIQLLDDATQTLIANAPKTYDVVVIVGSDKTS